VKLAGGIPFLSNDDLEAALRKAGVAPTAATAITEENADARVRGLQSALALLAGLALLALFCSGRIPTVQPAKQNPATATG
jgi:ferric-dicitrate binding protein FerR (iron transport regulator)